jgi:hypothetical protein
MEMITCEAALSVATRPFGIMRRRLKEDRNQHYNDLSCPCWSDPKVMARFREQPQRCSCMAAAIGGSTTVRRSRSAGRIGSKADARHRRAGEGQEASLSMRTRGRILVVAACAAAVGLFVAMLLQDNGGFVDRVLANAEARQCFEEAKRVEGERVARSSDPTDFSGSTLDEDIRACWEAFDRRTGDPDP